MKPRVCTLFLLACLYLAAATAVACTPQPALPGEQLAAFQPYLGRSLSYLARQVDATGLLRASSQETAAHHWLAPDNQLALWAFDTARAGDAATKLRAALAALPASPHGLIEAIHGAAVTWPPHVPRQTEIRPGIWTETYDGAEVIGDWEQDCSLALYAALNAWNGGRAGASQRLYAQAMTRFDGTGCPQAPGAYATSDLALAVLTGARIGAPVDKSLVDALLALQAPSGGFYAQYTAQGATGPTSTAATAYAALALMAVRQE